MASGYDSATVRMYTEKLVSRRDRMVVDLGLAQEIPPLRPAGVVRSFSYEPLVHGLVTVALPGSGEEVQAPVGEDRIVEGKLVRRDLAVAAQEREPMVVTSSAGPVVQDQPRGHRQNGLSLNSQ